MRSVGSPVEHLHVRRHNLSLVLRLLATHGQRSRADVAKITGLTRATVSSLVADLIDRGLVRELGPGIDQHIGRPATMLELDGGHVVTVGAEVNVGNTSILVNDLAGNTVYSRRRPLDSSTTQVDAVVPRIVSEIRKGIAVAEASGRQVVGITVAVPGVTDLTGSIVTLAPNLGWRRVPLLDLLTAELGHDIPIQIDNEANLGAMAEVRIGSLSGSTNLVYVLAADGVGAGVIVNGGLIRGASGAAGEVGHMTVQPRGALCACGSRGCWETTVGLRSLLRAAVPDLADELIADVRLSPEAKIASVTARANANDKSALRALSTYGHWLGIGLANIVGTFNPQGIILAGFLPDIAPWIMTGAMEAFWHNALSDSAHACKIELSRLGFSAAGIGGVILATDRIFANPLLVNSQPEGRALSPLRHAVNPAMYPAVSLGELG